MKPLAIGIGVFICTLGGALLGMWLRTALPAHHLRDESRDTMKLGIGLVATLTALVLGLVTASTKSSFDDLNTTIKHAAADLLSTDRLLARYGSETKEIRATLKQFITYRIEALWPQGSSQTVKLDALGGRQRPKGSWTGSVR